MQMRCALILMIALASVEVAHAQPDGQDFVLSPDVQAALTPHVARTRAAKPLRQVVASSEIRLKDSSDQISVLRTTDYEMREDGLLGVSSANTSQAGRINGTSRSQALWLCGLVQLLDVTSLSSATTSTGLMPLGKALVPFGTRSTADYSDRSRVTSFQSSAPSICEPTPDTTFDYRAEIEFTQKRSGLFGGTTTGRRVLSAQCRVGSEPRAASRIHPALEGDYLETVCETDVREQGKSTVTYAFLQSAGIYLLIGQAGDVRRQAVTLLRVEFAQ